MSVKLHSVEWFLKVSKFQNHRIKLTLFISICSYCLLFNHRQKIYFFILLITKLKTYFDFRKDNFPKKHKTPAQRLGFGRRGAVEILRKILVIGIRESKEFREFRDWSLNSLFFIKLTPKNSIFNFYFLILQSKSLLRSQKSEAVRLFSCQARQPNRSILKRMWGVGWPKIGEKRVNRNDFLILWYTQNKLKSL